MSYVKERMPRKQVGIILFQDIQTNSIAGAQTENGRFLTPAQVAAGNYRVIDTKPVNAEEYYAARKIANRQRAAAQTMNRKKVYLENVPQGYKDNFPHTFTTGRPFKIGSQRDSALNALNKTIAKVSGIPLNKENKAVIAQIYGDELKAAKKRAVVEFNKDIADNRFVKVKDVRYGRYNMKSDTGPMAKRVGNYSHIAIADLYNPYSGALSEEETGVFAARKRATLLANLEKARAARKAKRGAV